MKCLALAAVLLAAQTPSQFSGAWSAAHDGQTFARLELRASGGSFEGRISLGAMHMDGKGIVDRVDAPASNFTAIFDVQMRGGVLSFARKDGDDTDRFEVRRDGEDLELRFLIAPELAAELARDGVPRPAPVRLRRSP